MIVAALHRNITLSIVNSKELLHNGILKCIIRQLVLILIIASNFVLLYLPIKNVVNSWGDWIVWALIISLIEVLICGTIFAFIDFKTTKYIIMLLKKNVKSH